MRGRSGDGSLPETCGLLDNSRRPSCGQSLGLSLLGRTTGCRIRISEGGGSPALIPDTSSPIDPSVCGVKSKFVHDPRDGMSGAYGSSVLSYSKSARCLYPCTKPLCGKLPVYWGAIRSTNWHQRFETCTARSRSYCRDTTLHVHCRYQNQDGGREHDRP